MPNDYGLEFASHRSRPPIGHAPLAGLPPGRRAALTAGLPRVDSRSPAVPRGAARVPPAGVRGGIGLDTARGWDALVALCVWLAWMTARRQAR